MASRRLALIQMDDGRRQVTPAPATATKRWTAQVGWGGRSTTVSSTARSRHHCSLLIVLLVILCGGHQLGHQHNKHGQPTAATSSSQMLVQAQFLFTYEINQESDESRLPRSSLFDPSSFKIVTPAQLQSSYQKLASQLPPEQAVPTATGSLGAATTSQVSGVGGAPNDPPPTAASQPLPEPPTVQTVPSVVAPQTPASATSSFLKQTTAALQSFAELFHLTPSSSPAPAPLASLQTPPSSSSLTTLGAGSVSTGGQQQQQQVPTAATGIDQQAEARSLHEHWTQQQQRAHNQAGQQQQQVSAFQSFTTSPSVQGAHDGTQTGPAGQQHAGSPASYWLTSNPLNAPDGNFLVEIKNAGGGSESAAGQEASPSPQQPQQQQFDQRQPPVTLEPSLVSQHQPSVSSLTRPVSAQSSFLSAPTSAYFGLPASTNQPKSPASASAVHQPAASPLPLAPTPVSSLNERLENLKRQQHFQPQTQPLHQHQARSLSSSNNNNHHHHHQAPRHHQQQSQQARQTPASGYLYPAELPDSSLGQAQLRPPANTPENFAGGSLTGAAGLAPSRASVSAPLKSAEESLIAFRQQQQSQHDQQSALLAAVQNQLAAQAAANRSAAASPTTYGVDWQPAGAGNSLTDDELVGGGQSGKLDSIDGGEPRPKLSVSGHSNAYPAPSSHQHQQQQQQQHQHQHQHQHVTLTRQSYQQAAPASEIPKVSPQIYESFLLQQKDQYEKHLELLKQQQELNKLLEQKQQQEADKRKRKKDELERLEARKKANNAAAREQEQQAAARKARQEAEEARRKQLRQLQEEEEENKRRRQAEEERRYRELMEAREREEAKRRRQEADAAAAAAAAELARQRQQREQQERDALAEQQKRRREQAEAADEAAKQQQQYRNYLKQQEELKKLLELKQKEDEAAQARQRQAAGRLGSLTRASKLALEHKERARQTAGGNSHGAASQWGGRQAKTQQQPAQTGPLSTSTTTSTTAATSTSTAASVSTTTTTASRVGARLAAANSGPAGQANAGGQRRPKTDERLIRQKIPLYSGAGKYGLYRSDSDSELAKLLEAVTLPPSSATSPASTTTTSTTSTTTTPTPAASSAASDLLDGGELPGRGASLTSSSLSPLLNLHELSVTPATSPTAPAGATTGEPFSSTTIFDDDVPRRPVRNSASQTAAATTPTSSRTSPGTGQPRRSFPAPIAPAASVTSSTRTTLTNRMGHVNSSTPTVSSGRQQQHRGASIGLASLPPDSDNDGIPGRAGREYPVLAEVPVTSFSCSKVKLSGFFADTETACQVVHLCQDGVQSSILCPNGTIFNQEKFSCQWWYEVNCARAPMFYQLNDNLYKSTLQGDGPTQTLELDNGRATRTGAGGDLATAAATRSSVSSSTNSTTAASTPANSPKSSHPAS
jgi:hypothetical protein